MYTFVVGAPLEYILSSAHEINYIKIYCYLKTSTFELIESVLAFVYFLFCLTTKQHLEYSCVGETFVYVKSTCTDTETMKVIFLIFVVVVVVVIVRHTKSKQTQVHLIGSDVLGDR